jgi:hypothetical protein
LGQLLTDETVEIDSIARSLHSKPSVNGRRYLHHKFPNEFFARKGYRRGFSASCFLFEETISPCGISHRAGIFYLTGIFSFDIFMSLTKEVML